MMAIVHIDDAVAALTAEPGVYNIVDDDPLPVVSSDLRIGSPGDMRKWPPHSQGHCYLRGCPSFVT